MAEQPKEKEGLDKIAEKSDKDLPGIKAAYDTLSDEQKKKLYDIVDVRKIYFALQNIELDKDLNIDATAANMRKSAELSLLLKEKTIGPVYQEKQNEAQKKYPNSQFAKATKGKTFDEYADSLAPIALIDSPLGDIVKDARYEARDKKLKELRDLDQQNNVPDIFSDENQSGVNGQPVNI